MELSKLLDRSDDWLKYAVHLHLYHESKRTLADLRNSALSDDRIQRYLSDVANYHGRLVTNHKDPELPIHKLLFLLDIGLDTEVSEIQTAINEILKHKDEHGIYQSLINIPKHFGGSGEDAYSWCLCDAPLLLIALLKTGMDYHEYIKPGVDYLISLCRDNRFPCAASPELGKFRGPGKKDDCCPYATLLMTDLLSYIPEYQDSQVAVTSVNALLNLWEKSLDQHPYMFYMGTDFRKLKAPTFWYNIVSVVDVLSRYELAREDHRFQEMVVHIKSKQNEDGLFTPESVYQKSKGWDFGQKKTPSPYLTYLCYRIFEHLQ